MDTILQMKEIMIDPVAGMGVSRVCKELNRNSYCFEISRKFYTKAKKEMLNLKILKNISNWNQFELVIKNRHIYQNIKKWKSLTTTEEI